MSHENLLALLLESDDDDVTSSSDSEDEVIEAVVASVARTERNSIHNYSEMTILNYNEEEFITHFRVSKVVMAKLIESFKQNQIFVQHLHNKGKQVIEPRKHLELFLWYVGHSCSYVEVSDRFNITTSTVFEIITRMNVFFDEMAKQTIQWPSRQEMQRIQNDIYKKSRFPRVIGFMDGTHIKIDKPSHNQESYCNRKQYHSIQTQIICDDKCRIIDVFIGYPGSVHDARIFSASFIYSQLPSLCEDGHLLADSAYPCLAVCLTPYKDNGHLSVQQLQYNKIHSSLRIRVEHTNGLLKQRFRQLYHVKLRNVKRIVGLIKSCCVLHNLCQMRDRLVFDKEFNLLDATNIHDESNTTASEANVDFDNTTGAAKRNDIARLL